MDWLGTDSFESSESVHAILKSNFNISEAKIFKLVELGKGEKARNLCVKFNKSQFTCSVMEEILAQKNALEQQVVELKRNVTAMQTAMKHSDQVRLEALDTVNMLRDEFTHLMDIGQPKPLTARTPPVEFVSQQQVCQTTRTKQKSDRYTRRAPNTAAWSIRKP